MGRDAKTDQATMMKELGNVLSRALSGKGDLKDVLIKRTEAKQIVLPEGMEIDEAIKWLERKQKEEETEVGINHGLPFAPMDGVVAFHRALADIYGWTDLVPTPGFWSDTPPTMVGVEIGHNESMQVPWGRVQVPGIYGWLSTGLEVKPMPRFVLNGKVRKKSQREVDRIVKATEEQLRTNSIYRGKALRVNFDWLEIDEDEYNPTQHCPKFMDLRGVNDDDLVFGSQVDNDLRIGLFAPIERAAGCRRYGIPLKRGVLLFGGYGVGKTLTAHVTAKKAVKNGWTFIYLNKASDLVHGLRFAAQYSPSVVFCEDIDRVASGERNVSIDEILNTIDGVDTKGSEIITVFTTNHVESINPALLRHGRLDSLIHMAPPDAAAAGRLVQRYGRGLLAPDADLVAVGEKLQGKIPAFIREVVERSKIAALDRMNGGDIEGKVMQEDLLSAATAMQTHSELVEGKTVEAEKLPEVFVKMPSGHPHVKRVLQHAGANGE